MILGEVRTSLLPNSLALPRQAVADLLTLRPGRQVMATDRPINRTVSADSLLGVDCALPSEPRGKSRGVGTVAARAIVVGGLVAQSSTWAQLDWVDGRERKPWAHYARRRGVIEVIGTVTPEQVELGAKKPTRAADVIDLGSISQRLLTLVLGRPQLDHKAPLRTRPTSLRWIAIARPNATPSVHLHLDDDVRRTVTVVVPPGLLGEVGRFCEDLALHDWLYTALGGAIAQAERAIVNGRSSLDLLGAALALLVRLWMPGAHVDRALRPLWDDLETSPGFSGPWHSQVAWLRDQVSVSTLTAWHKSRG